MNVIWKRPDGFHDATPEDYIVVEVADKSRLWLHKKDKENFPFRVSGGWQDEDSTRKLNNLVNLLTESDITWKSFLKKGFHDSSQDKFSAYLEELKLWLTELEDKFKGDAWEVDIMEDTLNHVKQKISTFENNQL